MKIGRMRPFFITGPVLFHFFFLNYTLYNPKILKFHATSHYLCQQKKNRSIQKMEILVGWDTFTRNIFWFKNNFHFLFILHVLVGWDTLTRNIFWFKNNVHFLFMLHVLLQLIFYLLSLFLLSQLKFPKRVQASFLQYQVRVLLLFFALFYINF